MNNYLFCTRSLHELEESFRKASFERIKKCWRFHYMAPGSTEERILWNSVCVQMGVVFIFIFLLCLLVRWDKDCNCPSVKCAANLQVGKITGLMAWIYVCMNTVGGSNFRAVFIHSGFSIFLLLYPFTLCENIPLHCLFWLPFVLSMVATLVK